MEDAEGGLIDSELTSDTLLADVIVIRKMAFRVRCFTDALANGLKRLPVRIWDTSSRSHMGNQYRRRVKSGCPFQEVFDVEWDKMAQFFLMPIMPFSVAT